MDQLFIHDLNIRTIIGELAFERCQQQVLYLDVILFLDLSASARSDALSLSVDYTQVAEHLRLWTQERAPHLIETLAEHLCTQLLNHYPCKQVTLSVRKPSALATAREVGVTLTRRGSDVLSSS